MYKLWSESFKIWSLVLFMNELNQNKANYHFSHWKSLTILPINFNLIEFESIYLTLTEPQTDNFLGCTI